MYHYNNLLANLNKLVNAPCLNGIAVSCTFVFGAIKVLVHVPVPTQFSSLGELVIVTSPIRLTVIV